MGSTEYLFHFSALINLSMPLLLLTVQAKHVGEYTLVFLILVRLNTFYSENMAGNVK